MTNLAISGNTQCLRLVTSYPSPIALFSPLAQRYNIYIGIVNKKILK